jgi:hypothetical protein
MPFLDSGRSVVRGGVDIRSINRTTVSSQTSDMRLVRFSDGISTRNDERAAGDQSSTLRRSPILLALMHPLLIRIRSCT